MRITFLTDPDLVNSNYRAYQPLEALSRRGHKVDYNLAGRPIVPGDLLECDVVHIHRIGRPDMQQLARQLRKAGIGIVWDNDDDVTAMPRSNPLYSKFGGGKSRDQLAGVTQMVRIADVVTTPSRVLAEQYRGFGATDVRVLENQLPLEFATVRRSRHDGVVIAWLAALEHQVDYQQLDLRDTLMQLLEAHQDVRIVSFGLGLGLPSDRYVHLKKIPFLDIAQVLAQADVGIAPLTDIAWNRARSNIKLKEYAAGGLAWLASPVGPYTDMGEQQGGRLVPDGDWYAALERLVVNGRERRKLAKRATRWAKGEGIDQHVERWETVLSDAAQKAVSRRERAPARQ